MNLRALLLLNIILFYTSSANAGCPAMGIRNANVEIQNCSYGDGKQAGAAMDVNISYTNETWMAEQTAKEMKAKVFLYSKDKDICKKYELRKKTYCMDLQQWCVMSGPAPREARFTVNKVSTEKCPVNQNPMNKPSP